MRYMGDFGKVLLVAAGVAAFLWTINWVVTQDTNMRTRIAYKEWKRLQHADSLRLRP